MIERLLLELGDDLEMVENTFLLVDLKPKRILRGWQHAWLAGWVIEVASSSSLFL